MVEPKHQDLTTETVLVAEKSATVVKIGESLYTLGGYSINQHIRTLDMTPVAAKAAVDVARATYVEPVRAVMIGYVATVAIVAVLAVGLTVLAGINKWPWQIVFGAMIVLGCLIVPTRTLVSKLVEQMFKSKTGGA